MTRIRKSTRSPVRGRAACGRSRKPSAGPADAMRDAYPKTADSCVEQFSGKCATLPRKVLDQLDAAVDNSQYALGINEEVDAPPAGDHGVCALQGIVLLLPRS